MKMLPPDRYNEPGYNEDVALSDDLRYRRETEYAKVSPRFKLVTVIAPIAIFSTVFLGFHIMIAAGLAFFVLFLLFIIRINRDGDRITASCPACSTLMSKEVRANVEYHVCHSCKIFAKGRDWG
jgi:hypothetical protein